MEEQRQYPSQTPRRKIHTGLNLGTWVANPLKRHLAATHGNYMREFKKKLGEIHSLSA
jgi:hypothetical protein